MKKLQTLEHIQEIDSPALRKYLTEKTNAMFSEYGVDTLDDIGCFVLLDSDEIFNLDLKAMEFIEVLELDSETYLHVVKIISDNYGEDIFLPIERKTKWES